MAAKIRKKDKKDCVLGLMYFSKCVCKVSVFIWPGVFSVAVCVACVPSLFDLTICGLSCTRQERCATMAKVPVVGAAQHDKAGKMVVSEAPLNIIRR